MRSRAGVGTTPPKVPGAPKPTSSVMMSSTLGAPFGGTMRGAHQAFDSEAFSLITPPNFGSGGGSCFPSMVVVASGEPGTPVVCWAVTGTADSRAAKATARITGTRDPDFIFSPLICINRSTASASEPRARQAPANNSFLSHCRRLPTVEPTGYLSEGYSNHKYFTLNVPINRFE